MTKEELRKAAEALDERVDGKDTDKVDNPGLIELLGKAIDGLVGRRNGEEPIEKSEAEELAREETVAKSQAEGEEKFFDNVTNGADGQDLQEMIDAAPALESLTDAIAKSMGEFEVIRKGYAEQNERLAVIEEAMLPVLKGMQEVMEIMKSVRDQPVSRTSPGFVFAPTGRGEGEGGSDGPVPDHLREKMFKSMSEGKLDPKYVQLLDTRSPEEVYAMLPPGVLD